MPARLLPAVLLWACISCGREFHGPGGPDFHEDGAVQLTLTADVTSGTIPLTVSFTGALSGAIDTLLFQVPEVTFEGGTDQPPAVYLAQSDTLARAQRVYTAREHYFRHGTFRAVMKLHTRYGIIASDTCTVIVE